jgi:hypothetical protein
MHRRLARLASAFASAFVLVGCITSGSDALDVPGTEPGGGSVPPTPTGERPDASATPSRGGVPDLAAPVSPGTGGSPDLSTTTVTASGPVGPGGGSVNLLHFGLSGDTRPPSCEDTANYPTTVINSISDSFQAAKAQFALDLGDHMYVCNNDLATAQAQMGIFVSATKRFSGTWFMTMGNHECWKGPCLAGSTNANYVAFMDALAPITQLPYYSFDVQTSLGLATFVIVADNAWDNNQSAWLDQTLTTADQRAKYTIVARHHPEGDTSVATNPDSMAIIRQHKFSLFLTGHSHLYKHMTTDNGRDLVMGNSGAPLIAGGSFYGYAMVDQLPDGQLQLSVYDVNAGALVDKWSVGPNQ